ncbi:hypothetical protein [Flavobacterium salmonis]|uniref:Uncharacterized protein n=1 Tax=Flavobacterium salmonis TaxID=2654844 RepID=A0A6V6YWA8_9FLAO|nr:hypothetical protein [Flavobacterium salmonis]CAD0003817.1 hypothetical protein FLAT13_01879 [Flavobacterium salmonis]
MKKIVLLAVICTVIQSCNSQKKDLSKITFTEKYDTFFGDIPNEYSENSSMIDYNLYDVYNTESEKALNFNGVDLSGYRDKKGEFGTNSVSFEFSKKDRTLTYYYVTLFHNKNINKLIEAINSKVGKPSYVPSPSEGDTLPDAFLWEDKTSFYTLSGVTQNQADFIVFKKTDLTIRKKMLSAGNFQYYGDYLYHLEKNNLQKNVFSYKNFVDYKRKEGNNFYIDDYRKP